MSRTEPGAVNSGFLISSELVFETVSMEDVILRMKGEGRVPHCYKSGQDGNIKDNYPHYSLRLQRSESYTLATS